MEFIRKYRKYGIATAVALVLSIAVGLISLATLPDFYILEEPEESVSVLDQVTISNYDSIKDETGTIIPNGIDPQIVISGVKHTVSSLIVEMAEPVTPGIRYQLFFAQDGAEFTEGYSMFGYSGVDQKELVFDLPDAEYTSFRLDLDTAFRVEDIRISDLDPIAVKTDRMGQLFDGNIRILNGRQMVVAFAVLWMLCVFVAWKKTQIKEWFRKKWEHYQEDPKGFWIGVAVFVGCVLLGVLFWLVLSLANVVVPSFYSGVYFVLAGATLGGLLVFARGAEQRPERMMAVLILCVGLLVALMMPRTTVVSWDDESHYRSALDLSYGGESWITPADELMRPFLLDNNPDLETALAETKMLNDLYDGGSPGPVGGDVFHILYIAYMPAAAGIWIARALGLSFTATFVAGRVATVLMYVVVLYFAMKRLRSSSMLIGLYALIPTLIFIAGNYCYDSWCTAFLALGTAIFLDEYRHPERKLSLQDTILMLGSLMLGCVPKAIYFPVFLMCLFMPKEKFASKRSLVWYRIAVVGAALLMAFTFIGPLVFTSGARYGDTRGGSDVSGEGQLSYILGDPLNYTRVLLTFLFGTYFRPDVVMNNAIGLLAYKGLFPTAMATLVLFLIVFVAERPKEELARTELRKTGIWVKLASVLSFFCAVCMAASAMYIAFTPVGADTIAGCQERYMMPVLLPMLMQVRLNKTWMPIPQKYFRVGIALTEGVLLFAGFWPLMMSYV